MCSLAGSPVVLTCSALLSCIALPLLASDSVSQPGQLSSRGPGCPVMADTWSQQICLGRAGPHVSLMGTQISLFLFKFSLTSRQKQRWVVSRSRCGQAGLAQPHL